MHQSFAEMMRKPSALVLVFLLFVFTSPSIQSEEPPAIWQDLTPTEIKQWYTPTDLCMLQSEDRVSYPQTVRAEKCAAISGGVRKLQCGVGFSGSSIGNKGAPCFPPFVSRSSFLKGIVGYTDPLPKPMLEMLWNLHRSNMTMVWLGDSLMRQKLAAMECEVLREYPLLSSTTLDPHHGWVKSTQMGYTGCHQKLSLRLPMSAFMFLLQPYNSSSSSDGRVGGQRQLLNKKGDNKKGGGGGGKKPQRRASKGMAGSSLESSGSGSGGFISVDIHGLVLGKSGESCIRGGGPLGERAIARGESVIKFAMEQIKKLSQVQRRRLMVVANLGALYGEEKSDHGREPEERVEDHRKMFRGDIGRLFTGLGQLVDSPLSSPGGVPSPSASPRRHVVVWQETASQHWHNIPSVDTATKSTDKNKGKGKKKNKGKGKGGDSAGGGGVPSSYDFSWTASGYFSQRAEGFLMQRWFNTSPASVTNVDTLSLPLWQVPSCCAEFRSSQLARQWHRANDSSARALLLAQWRAAKEEEEAADWRNRLVEEQIAIFNAAKATPATATNAISAAPSSSPSVAKTTTSDSDKNKIVMSRYEDAIVMLPMVRYTKDAADMHTCHPVHQHDCTHLCYSPLLYQPLWHDLKRVTNYHADQA